MKRDLAAKPLFSAVRSLKVSQSSLLSHFSFYPAGQLPGIIKIIWHFSYTLRAGRMQSGSHSANVALSFCNEEMTQRSELASQCPRRHSCYSKEGAQGFTSLTVTFLL